MLWYTSLMKRHMVEVADDKHKILKALSDKTKWKVKDLVDRALENYFKIKQGRRTCKSTLKI